MTEWQVRPGLLISWWQCGSWVKWCTTWKRGAGIGGRSTVEEAKHYRQGEEKPFKFNYTQNIRVIDQLDLLLKITEYLSSETVLGLHNRVLKLPEQLSFWKGGRSPLQWEKVEGQSLDLDNRKYNSDFHWVDPHSRIALATCKLPSPDHSVCQLTCTPFKSFNSVLQTWWCK
jgi:hypothetical protein